MPFEEAPGQVVGSNVIPGFEVPIAITTWTRLVMALLRPWSSESQATWEPLLGYRIVSAYLGKYRSGDEREFIVVDLVNDQKQELRLLVERAAGERRDNQSSRNPERKSPSSIAPVKGVITKATDLLRHIVRRWSGGPLSRSSGINRAVRRWSDSPLSRSSGIDRIVRRWSDGLPSRSAGHLAADTVVRIDQFPPKAKIARTVEFSSTPCSQRPSLWDLMILIHAIHNDNCVYEVLDRQCFWFADSISAILERWSEMCEDVPVVIDAPSGCVKGIALHRRKPEHVEKIWAQFTKEKDQMNKERQEYEDMRQREVARTEELERQVEEQHDRERQEKEREMGERKETELRLGNERISHIATCEPHDIRLESTVQAWSPSPNSAVHVPHAEPDVQSVHDMESQLYDPPLRSLLNTFRRKEPKTPISSVVNTVTIGLMHELLSMKNYVGIVSDLATAPDVEVEMLLDFILYLLENGNLLCSGTDVLDFSHRARRLMFKIVSEMPAMPKSLLISGVKIHKIDPSRIFWGGFAGVFKGELRGMPVALKLLRKARHNNIYREALTWRLFRHEYVLPFLGIYQEHSVLFLVSPFMDGGTLSEWRSNRKPSAIEIQTRVLQVAQGLQYIHSQGIVHADIRGSNILLDSNFRPRIADFGLARHLEATGTHSDTLSPNFMAPELFGSWEDDYSDDTQKIGRTTMSDVYAFGCLYYEIHFNVIPFRETSYMRLVKQVTHRQRPKRLQKPALSNDAWRLINRCWKYEPSQRLTMDGVVEKMKRWSSSRGRLRCSTLSRNSWRTSVGSVYSISGQR